MSAHVRADPDPDAEPDPRPPTGAEPDPRPPTGEAEMELADFAWSDRIVGLGFFPHELALPRDWRWTRSA
ncbi:MAG: hypothetical protein QOG94_3578 [Solirubrobacteraceae bacterium]|nr:hypothetical protein [Solirubrobacteraceae bacterium]